MFRTPLEMYSEIRRCIRPRVHTTYSSPLPNVFILAQQSPGTRDSSSANHRNYTKMRNKMLDQNPRIILKLIPPLRISLVT